MDIVIKKSKIQGKGVFANRDFKKGEVVIKWDSCSREIDSTTKLSEEEKTRVLSLGEKRLLLISPNRYLNHSCQANTNTVGGYDLAVRDIKKGEEITGDYVKEKVPFLKMRCNCGSKDCLGTLHGEWL